MNWNQEKNSSKVRMEVKKNNRTIYVMPHKRKSEIARGRLKRETALRGKKDTSETG